MALLTKSPLLNSILLNPGAAGGGVSYETESLAIFAAFTTPPDTTRKGNINTMVAALKTAGVWSKLDVMYAFAAADSQASLINWKNPGTFNASAVNTPTFTTDRGYAGNGSTSYVNSTFTPSTAGGNFVLNSAHLGLWSRTNAQAAAVTMGARTTSTTEESLLRPRDTGNLTLGRINKAGGGVNPANTDSSGHFVTRRSGGTAAAIHRNGSSLGSNTEGSTALPQFPIFIGALNTAGSASSFSTYQIAAAHWGSSLSDTEITDTYNALLAYLQAVGAA